MCNCFGFAANTNICFCKPSFHPSHKTRMSSTNMPKRPDKGGAKGKQIQVKANIFKASLPDVTFYHYDVAITPEVPPPKARLVWQQAEVLMKETLKENVFLAYDGQKSAYGVKNLADMTFSLVSDKKQHS